MSLTDIANTHLGFNPSGFPRQNSLFINILVFHYHLNELIPYLTLTEEKDSPSPTASYVDLSMSAISFFRLCLSQGERKKRIHVISGLFESQCRCLNEELEQTSNHNSPVSREKPLSRPRK